MKLKGVFHSTAVRLAIAIVTGIFFGFLITLFSGAFKTVCVQALLVTKQITSQVIFFMVPLIIFVCVAP